MRSFTAGETITIAATIAGTGALSSETFEARAYAQSGVPLSALAEITDAASREVTLTIAAGQWREGSGGYGRLELLMTSGATKTVELSEEFRITPGLSARNARLVDGYEVI